ncbi:MAG TPA: hypothetical protein VF200_08915 [Woeseiaceae bacterium]
MTSETEEQEDAMTCGLGVAERELLHEKLAALPDTVPPRAVWQRIEAQARAEGLLRRAGSAPHTRWLAGAGLAATVVLGVLNFDVLSPASQPREDSRQSFPTEPPYSADRDAVRLQTLRSLMVRSQQLEQDLRALPEEPQVVRVGTAATIAAVQDQIAAIDYQLNQAPSRMAADQEELYWRERVRLMNLLVQLRVAQAQRTAF